MHKLLIFEKLSEYDVVIYIDTDIVINPSSPEFPYHHLLSIGSGLLSAPHVPWEGVRDYAQYFSYKYCSDSIPQGGVLCLASKKEYEAVKKLYYGKVLPNSHPVHAPDQILLGMYYGNRDTLFNLDPKWNFIPPITSLPSAHRFLPYKFPYLRNATLSLLLRTPRYKNRFLNVLNNNYFVHMAGGLKQYIPAAISLYSESI